MPAVRSWRGYIKRLHPEHSFTADSLAIMDSIICDLCCKICSAAMVLVKANNVKTVAPDTAKLAVKQVMHSSASRKGFPAHRVMRCLKEHHGAERVSAKAPAIIAGALAHACHSICSLATKITQEDGRQRIRPKDVLRSVHQLREKTCLPVDGIIAAAGVIGHEQPKKRKPETKRKSSGRKA